MKNREYKHWRQFPIWKSTALVGRWSTRTRSERTGAGRMFHDRVQVKEWMRNDVNQVRQWNIPADNGTVEASASRQPAAKWLLFIERTRLIVARDRSLARCMTGCQQFHNTTASPPSHPIATTGAAAAADNGIIASPIQSNVLLTPLSDTWAPTFNKMLSYRRDRAAGCAIVFAKSGRLLTKNFT